MNRLVYISVYGTKEPEQGMYERLLYKLLEERKPYQNISHKKMPTFVDHVKFVRGKPYKNWCIVQEEDTNQFLGSIYITNQDEIGIFLFDQFQYKGYGKRILNDVFEICPDIPLFKANIAPLNSASLAFFTNNGFKHNHTMLSEDQKFIVQYTYIKSNPYCPVLPKAHGHSAIVD